MAPTSVLVSCDVSTLCKLLTGEAAILGIQGRDYPGELPFGREYIEKKVHFPATFDHSSTKLSCHLV